MRNVKKWREDNFLDEMTNKKIEMYFPLWDVSYESLMEQFKNSGARSFVSAVADDSLKGIVSVGDEFNQEFIEKLPDGVDKFGENGEFHTLSHKIIL